MKVQALYLDKLPLPQTEDSIGADIYAELDTPLRLDPLERFAVPTSIYTAIPKGYGILILPRSGLAAKKGITVLNAPGLIDPDYILEHKVILVNLSKDVVVIEPGERIAQMAMVKFEKIEWDIVESLDETSRKGGFGSTGEK